MRRNILTLWSLCLLLVLVVSAQSETIYVDAANAGDPDEDGTLDHPFDAIQEGIDAAAETGDTIQVAVGTYMENVVWDHKSLALQGAGAGSSIVDGNQAGSCLYLWDVPAAARIEGFTFRNGYNVLEGGGGGGILLMHSTCTVVNNEITGNSAEMGGGMALIASPATVMDNVITGNSAGSGGGMVVVAASDATLVRNVITWNHADSLAGLWIEVSNATLIDNIITDNTAVNYYAGGLILNASDATLTGNTISRNSAPSGGGLFLTYSNATLMQNTIQDNNADFGAGLSLINSDAVLESNTISGNSAQLHGGGLYLSGSDATLTGNTISDNTAESGGGLLLGGSAAALTDNVIEGNRATGGGGGVNLHQSSPTLESNTISDNTAEAGGGLYGYDSPAQLKDNLFLNNSATHGGGGFDLYESDATLADNTISDNTADFYAGGTIVNSSALLVNNTFQGNSAAADAGGIYLSGSSPILTGNSILGNTARYGGGMFVFDCAALLEGNRVFHNTAVMGGGLLFFKSYNDTLVNNFITDNTARGGGGVYCDIASPLFTNNTMTHNQGGGLLCPQNATVTNSILWGNSGEDDLVGTQATYSDIGTGETEGEGNISEDPLFVDPDGGDYHLQSISPCINQGNNAAPNLPDTDIDGDPRVIESIVDMGADESLTSVVLQPDLWIQQQTQWLGDNIYNQDGTEQTATQTMAEEGTAVYLARLYNDGEETDTIWIKGPPGNANWTVRYYWGTQMDSSREVTKRVISQKGWKRANVPPGERRSFLIAVTSSPSYLNRFEMLAEAVSARDPRRKDCIQTFTAVADLQPDLWVKRGSTWIGDNIYNDDGTDQKTFRKVVAGSSARCRARVENDGAVKDHFYIQGPAGDDDWTVQYYQGWKVDAAKEVTAEVTSAEGWKRPNVAPGAFRNFLIVMTPRSGLPVDSKYVALVRVEARWDASQQDAIKMTTKVKSE